MTWWKWSTTAATNSNADSTINWAEGQAPSSVNDSARATMAGLAKFFLDESGSLLTTGGAVNFAVTTNGVFDTLAHLNGFGLRVRFNVNSGAAPTLNVDGLGAKAIQVASGTAVGTGVIAANSIWWLTYDNSASAFILSGVPLQIQDGTVATASIAAQAVTYAKIQNVSATSRILGRLTAGAGVTEELTIGTGAVASGTTLNFTGTAPPGGFKNLSIKVASNTTVIVAADFVTVTDGTNYQTLAVSGTTNLGTNGAVNALDASTIAIDTWYAIWAIAKADGTQGTLASTSFTAPTMPTGYTYKARIGAVQTIHGSATLYGTWQLGRRAQYVVGLAQTTAMPIMGSANVGIAAWTAIALARFVPTTAAEIVAMINLPNTNASIALAPNNSYGNIASLTNPPPLALNAGSGSFGTTANILLESTNIYYQSNSTGNGVFALGWIDNI